MPGHSLFHSQPFATRRTFIQGAVALPLAAAWAARGAYAASAKKLNAEADAALAQLYAATPRAAEIAKLSRAILIFPEITKAGLVLGGQEGTGVLREGGKATGYYQIVAASVGLQAGVQTFSLAMFFITKAGLDGLRSAEGWSIGSGPSLVIADEGAAANINTTSLKQDVYAFPFGQRGLMAGIDIEGSKISRLDDVKP